MRVDRPSPRRYPHGGLTEASAPPPVAANRTERKGAKHKRRLPIALVIVPVVVVATIAAVILVLSGGEGGGILGNGPDDTVPEFDFTVKRSEVVPTAEAADVAALEISATQVQSEITPVLDDLFTNAFLDPSNWREGDYAEVLEAFAPGALSSAQQGLEAITLGAGAGDVYEVVEPTKGSLEYTILFDPEGIVDTAVVKFRFYALGERKDATYMSIVSHGQLFLQDVDGWKITAFDVIRNDAVTTPPAPAPSGSASTTPSS